MDIKNLRLYKAIFGYDIFISYSRADGLDYAYAIAQHFMLKGYECYIDQLSSSSPGKKLPKTIEGAVTRSAAFVLVGSNGAKTSEPITQEINLFLKYSKNKPLIPISINKNVDAGSIWFDSINGLTLIDETLDNLQDGNPADKVLGRIGEALKFTKKSKRLRLVAVTTIIAVIIITVLSVGYALIEVDNAAKEIIRAKAQAEEQKKIALQANKQAKDAVAKIKIADSITKGLALKSDSLSKQIALKNSKIDEAMGLYTSQYKSAQKMYDEFGKAIDALPGIKSYCTDGNLTITKGELMIYFKLDNAQLTKGGAAVLNQFIEDWRASSNRPKIIVAGHHAAYTIDEESLNVFKLNSGGTKQYNLSASNRISKSIVQYLISKGIPKEKVTGIGYGDTQPVFNKSILLNNRAEISTAN